MKSFSALCRRRISFLRANLESEPGQSQFGLSRPLLIVTFAALQLIGSHSNAQPSVIAGVQFTDRFGPHSLPGLPVGDRVQVYAFIESSDPPASPTVSVAAIQGATTLALEVNPLIATLYPGQHVYTKLINFDPSLLGPWKIIPSDSTGTGPPDFTNAIAKPQFVPFVENIVLGGAPRGASVSWTLPNLAGFDVDATRLRLIEASTGLQVFQSDDLAVQTTHYAPPASAFRLGVDYVYRISLNDYDDDYYFENRSNAFSAPFRYKAAGDFNADGAVDAADLVQWQGDFGLNADSDTDHDGDSDGADVLIWQREFNVGSSTARPSAVPEPHSATLACILVCSPFARRRIVNGRRRRTLSAQAARAPLTRA